MSDDPAAFDVEEVRIVLGELYNTLFVLLGRNTAGFVGGWWRRQIEPKDTLRILHQLLEAGILDEGWERGGPLSSAGKGAKNSLPQTLEEPQPSPAES